MEESAIRNVSVAPHTEHPAHTVLLVLAGCTFGYALSCVLGGPASDEGFHAPQIWHYYQGGTDHFDNITVPTTYHYVIGFVMRQIGYYHDYLLRLTSLLVALCVLPVFYQSVRRYLPEHAGVRTQQLFFTPLMFPYFFMIYTDLWALLFVATCFYFTLGRRYILGGLAALVAVLLRQDSIIWVGLAYLLVATENLEFRRPLPIKPLLGNAFKRGAPLALVLLLFLGFVIYNGGVAVGDRTAHQISQFNISNLYVLLTCAWLLFFPLCIQQAGRILALRHCPKVWPWVVLLVLGGFLFYMGTFSNPHPYNNTLFHFFMHNGLMYLMSEYVLFRALLYIPIAWMALTLCVMPYPDKRCYWLLLVAPIAVISHPLIEPRYYFPIYLLIQLWRPAMNTTAEWFTLAYYIVAASFIMYGTVTGWFFL
ncbi:hypothetical protein [Marinimicrobium locisalis]|uniref:hypothetical protein n=1 Tax=Marinimicrobium locisalis TaxID=546022 RepID=UPI0032217080